MKMGVESERVLRRAELPLDLFSRGMVRLPAERHHALWAALTEELEGREPAVMLAHAVSIEEFDPPLFAAVVCADLNRAADRLVRYKPLVGPLRLVVDRAGGTLTLQVVWSEIPEPPSALVHAELMSWVALSRLATRSSVTPVRYTAPSLPENREAFRGFLGVEPTAGEAWSVSFSARDAQLPFLTTSTAMWSAFEPLLRRRLYELPVDAKAVDQVRASLLELLPAGLSSAHEVSRRLAVSKRTLQRRLKEEEETFQGVLNSTRESLARHYLSRGDLSTPEVAFLLGYDDPNSFYRAFSSWTGLTPESVRSARAS